MIKIVTPLRKKPGLSTQEFRRYYEKHHRLIGEKYLKDYASHYARRYMTALPDREGKLLEPEFDVILEVWYADEASLQACSAKLGEPAVAREILDDEAKLFDCAHIRSYVLEECESNLEA
jgi:hypothetical protein